VEFLDDYNKYVAADNSGNIIVLTKDGHDIVKTACFNYRENILSIAEGSLAIDSKYRTLYFSTENGSIGLLIDIGDLFNGKELGYLFRLQEQMYHYCLFDSKGVASHRLGKEEFRPHGFINIDLLFTFYDSTIKGHLTKSIGGNVGHTIRLLDRLRHVI
jgi:hypothetical protein